MTIEWFSKVLEWFGPFTLDSSFIDNTTKTISIKYRHPSFTRPNELRSLLRRAVLTYFFVACVRGFWGDITKDQATQFLVGKKEVRCAALPSPPHPIECSRDEHLKLLLVRSLVTILTTTKI